MSTLIYFNNRFVETRYFAYYLYVFLLARNLYIEC